MLYNVNKYALFDHDDDGDDLDDLGDDAGNRSSSRWTIIMIMYACLARSRAFTLAFLISIPMVSRTSGCNARHKHGLVSYIRKSRLYTGSRASRKITTRERCSATRSDASSRTQAAAGLVLGKRQTPALQSSTRKYTTQTLREKSLKIRPSALRATTS
ncbi:unnamed protein product [Trichogramma brassicae]|uniref:Uncharacterized protein n=1 Tax=Trichogramma brassicae TaxID=86971 RepID=A0A6H5HUN6_9HYME|nr:unnamed protein product [Trichogramma brassicae]